MECCMCKIFVGNVPFDCSKDEFSECFKNMAGFIKAEIIYKNSASVTKISRGFGFVTFETPEHAKILLDDYDKNCIMFKDRKLRFTQYVPNIENNLQPQFGNKSENSLQICHNLHTKKQYMFNDGYVKNKNFLIVKNINESMTRKELHDIFSKFSSIGKHFIVTDQDTGTLKSYAVVEIMNDIIYDLLLQQKEIKYNSSVFEIAKWRLKSLSIERKYVINKK